MLGFRFPASEAQRQGAELTHLLAKKINSEGTDPESDAGRKVVDGTATSLAYTGRPKQMPNPDEFNTINDQAGQEAVQSPNIGGILDSGLEIGLGIAALMTGAGGIKLAQNLRRVHAKAKGFTEVVGNNEQFKRLATQEVWDLFKRAQVIQTEPTRKLVAETKTENKIVNDNRF